MQSQASKKFKRADRIRSHQPHRIDFSAATSPEKTLAMFAIVVVIAFALVLSYSYFLERTPQRGIQTVTSTITKAFTIVSRTMVTGPPNQTKAAGFDAVAIYIEANASVVTVSGSTSSGLVVGSGFVTAYQNSTYILTNFHVVDSVSDITVTFWDGNSYPARMIASDPYSDLAILTTEAPHFEFPHPLSLYPSSFLNVGQTVVAIGAPFGLSGSMTVGIISQLGRTLQDPTAGNFSIAAVIQFSAPINPGNSGGPLLDSNGDVVGITTAVVQSSQGVGFAIPSDTIMKEIPSLVTTGSYNQHSYLGIGGADMNYQLSQASRTNVTYGVLIENVVPGGPASNAGLRAGSQVVTIAGQQYLVGGDIIISINGTRIVNNDALATYLEEHTVSGQMVTLGIIRGGSLTSVNLKLGARPPIS